MNLLMRFHEIQNGDIKIDGISTRDMKREEVRSQFCMVLQDTWLFEGTVREKPGCTIQRMFQKRR